ncbi:MAG: hypothetical protein ABI051_15040 [Vicinamibacterales bacterium]
MVRISACPSSMELSTTYAYSTLSGGWFGVSRVAYIGLATVPLTLD